jgi:hypothetical protein
LVDGITGLGLGRWRRVEGLDHGGFEEDLMTARRLRGNSTMVRSLRGGLDDGVGFGEADNGVGSREIFGGKFS